MDFSSKLLFILSLHFRACYIHISHRSFKLKTKILQKCLKTLSQESVIAHMHIHTNNTPSLHMYYQVSICQTTKYHISEDHTITFVSNAVEPQISHTHAGSQLGQNIRVYNKITINCNTKITSQVYAIFISWPYFSISALHAIIVILLSLVNFFICIM